MTLLRRLAVLRRNPGQKFLSLAIAAALWWYVAGENQVQMGHVVPLEIRNVPAGTVVTNQVERQVELRLSAPPALLGTLKPYQVAVSVDLGDLGEGRHSVPLRESDVSLPRGVRVTRIFPPAVEVHLERLARKTVPVHPVLRYPPGETRRPVRVEADPAMALVEGSASEIGRIRSVETEELLPSRFQGTFRTEAPLLPPGGHARILEPRTVRVRATFR